MKQSTQLQNTDPPIFQLPDQKSDSLTATPSGLHQSVPQQGRKKNLKNDLPHTGQMFKPFSSRKTILQQVTRFRILLKIMDSEISVSDSQLLLNFSIIQSFNHHTPPHTFNPASNTAFAQDSHAPLPCICQLQNNDGCNNSSINMEDRIIHDQP